MIEQLFGSKTRVKLLQLFMSNPNRAFYVREITRKVDEQINSVRRELANLLSIGIIKSEEADNRLYYEVNQTYQHYESLKAIFSGKKGAKKVDVQIVAEAGPASKIVELGSVELALLTGGFTRDNKVGVDLIIVGDVNRTKLGHFIDAMQAEENREIDYVVLSPEDFDYRRDVNDRFISDVMSAKKTVLIDTKGRIKQ
jgi:hypothetical protein